MPVYVDASAYGFGRMIMCHMIADTPEELHAMADTIGVARKWFQAEASFPHYDIAKSKRALAVAAGAIEVNARELVGHMQRLRPAWGVYGLGNPAPKKATVMNWDDPPRDGAKQEALDRRDDLRG